jgi:hypothetical protein
LVSIVATQQRHVSTGPKTVAQQKMAGERGQLTEQINELIIKHTGRRDLCIHDSKNVGVMNLLKIRDVLVAMDAKLDVAEGIGQLNGESI